MAFTNGTLYGKYDGSTANNGTQDAFTGSNLNNPNKVPALDLFQILAPGGACLLQVTAAYVVNTNVAKGSFSSATIIQTVQMTIAQYNSLPANPTAAQICQAAFPVNYNNQQLDIFQIEADEHSAPVTHSSFIAGGGAVVWRLLYNGSTATS
jgi:hypothetical protein